MKIYKLPVFNKTDMTLREDRRTYGDLADWLKSLEMGESEECEEGTTWLELFVAAEMAGIRMDNYDPAFQVGGRAGKKNDNREEL